MCYVYKTKPQGSASVRNIGQPDRTPYFMPLDFCLYENVLPIQNQVTSFS